MSEQQLATVAPTKSITVAMAERFGMEAAPFEATLRATVCKGNVSREEFAAFLLVAREYNLNPLTKEIFAFPAKGGGIVPVVSIDGWCRIVNEHKAMNGLQFIYENDEAGKLVSVTCRIHRKDREQPIEVPEFMDECAGTSDVWKRWPRRMLRHKALIQAARYAFGFSGIFDEDEYERMESARDVSPQSSGLMARLSGSQEGAGFDHEAVIEEISPKESVAAKRAARKAAAEEPKVIDAEVEGRPTETASAQDADAGQGSLETAAPVSDDGAEETSGAQPSEEPTQSGSEVVNTGQAKPGIVYLMAGEEATPDGRRMTYKNGERFSGKKDVAGIPTYTEHAPIVDVEEETPATEAQAAEETLDSLPADMAPEVKEYALQVKGAKTFQEVKAALSAMQKSPFWGTQSLDEQNELRFNTWDMIQDLPGLPEPHTDVSAFRLWIEWEEEPEAIEAMLSKMEETADFKAKSDGLKENVRGAVAQRLKDLEEG